MRALTLAETAPAWQACTMGFEEWSADRLGTRQQYTGPQVSLERPPEWAITGTLIGISHDLIRDGSDGGRVRTTLTFQIGDNPTYADRAALGSPASRFTMSAPGTW